MKKSFFFFPLSLFFLVFVGSSCAIETAPTGSANRPQIAAQSAKTAVSVGGSWETLSEEVSYMKYFFAKEQLAQLHLYKIDPRMVEMRLLHDEENPQSLTGWAKENQSALVVVNGVYFSDDYFPSGYLRYNGEQIGDRAFPDDVGFIAFDDTILLSHTSEEKTLYQNSAQTHPVIIANQQGMILSDDGEKAWRTIIGQDQEGMIYIGVVPRKMVTLFELMTILENMDIAWETVLNLDGGSSTGLSARVLDHSQSFNSYSPLPHVFVIDKKK